MQKNFFNDDFEDFLKQNAEEFRMPPSERVWENISKDLKKRRRRIGYFTSAFLLLSSCMGYLLINSTKEIATPEVAVTSNDPVNSIQEHTTDYPSLGISIPKPPAKVINLAERVNAKQINLEAKNAIEEIGTIRQSPIQKEISSALTTTGVEQQNEEVVSSSFTPTIVDSDVSGEISPSSENSISASTVSENILSIESVTNIFRIARLNSKKTSFQFFFTPTISYRKLSENKSYLRSLPASTVAAINNAQFNVNNAVTHKPNIGVEVGMNAKYQIAKSINLRGGIQFNINRYDIKAFSAPTEVATIALTNRANQVDFVGATTNYRNFSGYKTNWLQNFYFQVSAPVGLEFKVFSNKNTQFGIAGTIQPTYVLGEKAYLLSTDYKNYTQASWLSRKWNVNTALETYVSYSTGKMQWQVGPQIRYQLLSSFISEYPLKENLFDFGLRVGISINKKDSENKSQ